PRWRGPSPLCAAQARARVHELVCVFHERVAALECGDPEANGSYRGQATVESPSEQAGQRGGAAVNDEMMDMAALLEQEESGGFHSLRRGEVVEGTIISVGRDGVIVDIGAKSEGLIPVNEMHSLGADPLKHVEAGDKIVAYVMQPETSDGDV